MSVYVNAGTDAMDATISGFTAASRVSISAWVKHEAAQALNSSNMAVDVSADAAAAHPSVRMRQTNASSVASVLANGVSLSGGAITDDTWTHLFAAYGPWTGSPVNRRIVVNGANTTSNTSNTASSVGMNSVRIGNALNVVTATTAWKGWLAEVGLWTGLSVAQEDTLITELLTTHVDKVTIPPNFSWRLHTSGLLVAATGGVTLTNNTATAAADDPAGLTGDAPPAVTRTRSFVMM